jgi:hypothetical protein
MYFSALVGRTQVKARHRALPLPQNLGKVSVLQRVEHVSPLDAF